MKLLECFLCCVTVCGCKNIVTRAIAFFPPDPPGYRIFRIGKSFKILLFDENGNIIQPLIVPWVSTSIIMLTTSTKSIIPAIFYRNINSDLTLIFSHGNSTDIGIMYNYISDLVIQIKANILLFEYSGYGEASGKPSETQIYADIQAAYDFLISIGIEKQSIVLYGQSIGSAAVCDLASKVQVAGVILHSPLASGLHFIKEKPQKSAWYNAFPNLKKVSKLNCPVFIMHGTEDEEIPHFHGELLVNELQSPWPPWFPQAGHNDIEEKFRKIFLDKLDQFFSMIKEGIDSNLKARESSEKKIYIEDLEKIDDYEKIAENPVEILESPVLSATCSKVLPDHT